MIDEHPYTKAIVRPAEPEACGGCATQLAVQKRSMASSHFQNDYSVDFSAWVQHWAFDFKNGAGSVNVPVRRKEPSDFASGLGIQFHASFFNAIFNRYFIGSFRQLAECFGSSSTLQFQNSNRLLLSGRTVVSSGPFSILSHLVSNSFWRNCLDIGSKLQDMVS